MNYSEANAYIGKTVTFWSDNSGSYIEGVLVSIDPVIDLATIRVGNINEFITLDNVHAGSIDEVDGGFMATENGQDLIEESLVDELTDDFFDTMDYEDE